MEDAKAELFVEVKWICQHCEHVNELDSYGHWLKGDVLECDQCEESSVVDCELNTRN